MSGRFLPLDISILTVCFGVVVLLLLLLISVVSVLLTSELTMVSHRALENPVTAAHILSSESLGRKSKTLCPRSANTQILQYHRGQK